MHGRGRPGSEPERGSQPFKPDEIRKLREQAKLDALAFALLRWTGLRGSDAVALTWADVDLQAGEIVRVTQKRGKRVVVPIHKELLFALETEHDKREPQPWDKVLVNPETGAPLTRPRLYERMMALGPEWQIQIRIVSATRSLLNCYAKGLLPTTWRKFLEIRSIRSRSTTLHLYQSCGSACGESLKPYQIPETWARIGHHRRQRDSKYNKISG
jgi:integrase